MQGPRRAILLRASDLEKKYSWKNGKLLSTSGCLGYCAIAEFPESPACELKIRCDGKSQAKKVSVCEKN